ncbi:NAD(P)/FAD-dependent oxidoreductase [Humibacter ginsenosidimutans]|uniref:FAD-dependent oxidoreductase n=1 Tax=Humibacter ginsenosidimutans TaxID=2599293 RepID=A0A5B8M563_9MICO|nr:FAD-dependent oxidoreductase [Humibacter ginsenosidimutans]QDZ15898.1 FAD-dependent oxidoreductase [Humibacter ginsenosidimutans]
MSHEAGSHASVSFWYSQVAAPTPRPALTGHVDADVCIVGAGFTGLWTAYYLKKVQPSLRVVVLEQRFAGYGASGRNGGWLTNSVTGGREQYIATHGREGAQAMQSAMTATVHEVMRVAEAEGIDADIVLGGELNVARNAAQLARLQEWAEGEAEWADVDAELLDAGRASARIDVAGALGGLWQPHCARIQPAKLVRGLADVVESLGVQLYEGTTVTAIEPRSAGRRPEAVTRHGAVSADVIVRATEGFTARMPGAHRAWVPLNSSLIVTEPLSDAQWDAIGWANRDTLGDLAHVYMYAQRTADGRIAFGGRGVPYHFGSRFDLDGTTPEVTVRSLRELLVRFFPVLGDVKVERAWSGVLGVPRDWSATVGLDRKTGLGWAGGYVGTGVTATNLAGRTLTDLVLQRDTALTALPWVGHRVRNWEVEPLRYVAVNGLYKAYGIADRAEDRGSTSTSVIARVADWVSGHK